uniref:Transcription elongation factor n=1 Tax=Strongyloides venezuelensis TaxID=75913 RepID=A0A0K0F5P2_STRVS
MPSISEKDILDIKRRLQQMIDGQKEFVDAPELIAALEGMDITIDILKRTFIGITVNELRKKSGNEALNKRIKSLVKKWKSQMDTNVIKKPSNTPPQQDTPTAKKPTNNIVRPQPTPSTFTANVKIHKDEYRNKVIGMFISAFNIAELPEGTLDPEDLAVRIEEEHYKLNGGTNDKYKAAIRSKIFNLRDKKNPDLRANVLTGVITPERFATMTSEDMASDAMKKQREKYTQEAIREHQMSVAEGTPTDMFKCGKCRKYNCTYTQVQTRSADEPMTTFVFCRECGNRWKFC